MFTLRKYNRWLTTATATALVKKNMILMIVGVGEKNIARGTTDPWVDTITGGTL